LVLSGALHGALALTLAQVEPEAPRRQQPLLIDFTVDVTPGPPARSAGPSQSPEPVRARPVRPHQARRAAPVVPAAVSAAPAAPLATAEEVEGELLSEGVADGGVAQPGSEGRGEAQAGVEGATGGLGAATAAYNRAHFEYLRREIHQRLVYPELAREMGWEGRVLLSFLVAQDGSVKEVAVTESSGIALLDRSAVATLHRAAPLPRPPCDVRVVMPIAYVLR
jgi:protein TonB